MPVAAVYLLLFVHYHRMQDFLFHPILCNCQCNCGAVLLYRVAAEVAALQRRAEVPVDGELRCATVVQLSPYHPCSLRGKQPVVHLFAIGP
jgi:hypothetical protein